VNTEPDTPIPDAAIESLEAYLSSYDEGPDAALRKLDGRTDPDSINQSLRILIEGSHFAEAEKLGASVDLDEKWCMRAAFVAARQGDVNRVGEILDWAGGLADLTVRRRCVLANCEGALTRILNDRASGNPLLPGRLSESEETAFVTMLENLRCITDIVNANGRVGTALEAQALVMTMNAHYLLGNQDEVRRFCELLATRQPLPLEIGKAILQFGIPASPELVDRLRKENQESFEAGLLASVIEGKSLDQPAQAFESALELLRTANSSEEKEGLFSVLYDFAQDIGGRHLSGLMPWRPNCWRRIHGQPNCML